MTVSHPEFESVPLPRTNEQRKAQTYCALMRHKDAPLNFRIQVIRQLQEWQLVNLHTGLEQLSDYSNFNHIVVQAREKANMGNAEFVNAFNQNPWNFDKSVEGEYGLSELDKLFPRALEINALKGDGLKFLFRSQPGEFYLQLVVTPDGKRFVLRVVDSERTIEQINQDANISPPIIPRFEAMRFSDGKTGLLIEWINGHTPEPNQRTLCLQYAEQLLQVPIDSYDLWRGNFLVATESDVQYNPRIYYIDNDIPETIARYGLSPETAAQRKTLFEEGSEKFLG